MHCLAPDLCLLVFHIFRPIPVSTPSEHVDLAGKLVLECLDQLVAPQRATVAQNSETDLGFARQCPLDGGNRVLDGRRGEGCNLEARAPNVRIRPCGDPVPVYLLNERLPRRQAVDGGVCGILMDVQDPDLADSLLNFEVLRVVVNFEGEYEDVCLVEVLDDLDAARALADGKSRAEVVEVVNAAGVGVGGECARWQLHGSRTRAARLMLLCRRYSTGAPCTLAS